jgi:hypothetical protein
MGLSKRYTSARAWREIVNGFTDVPNDLDFMALDILERSLYTVVGSFFDLYQPFYMQSALAGTSNVQRHLVSGGSYIAATQQITATMDSNFVASDVENTILFRATGVSYIGKVKTFVDGSHVIFGSDNLPGGDIGSLDAVEMVSTAVTSDTISLSNLNIASFGAQAKISIDSSVCDHVDILPMEEFKNWDVNAQGNKASIVCALEGYNGNLKRGFALANYGTLVFHFPKPPDQPDNVNTLDLPDGPGMDLLILKGMSLAAPRFKREVPATLKQDAAIVIQNLLRSFGTQYKLEAVKDKVEAIL